MKKILLLLFIGFSFAQSGCGQAIKVEVKKEGNKYQLYRGGEPYFIQGAGGVKHIDKLKEYGGNSIRLWSTDNALEYLDRAHELGLTVTLGLFMMPERMGFDYSNQEAVDKQKEYLKSEVLKYKDHPALLMWGIGNELELLAKNQKVWDAINDVSKMIHDVDPNHPTTTMLAGLFEKDIKYISSKCKDLDLLSVNAFKDLPYIPGKLEMWGWKKPYIISEFGSDGYWETKTTAWDAFYEPTSTQKAEQYSERYTQTILANRHRCLGSYVFYWGDKFEKTHTYFSMFLDSGHETEAVEVMRYLWSGKKPEKPAPKIEHIRINNKAPKRDFFLSPGSVNTAKPKLIKTNPDNVYYYWELYKEHDEEKMKSDTRPPLIQDAIEDSKGKTIKFKAPEDPGAYRLFVTIYDENDKVATANIPFFVK